MQDPSTWLTLGLLGLAIFVGFRLNAQKKSFHTAVGEFDDTLATNAAGMFKTLAAVSTLVEIVRIAGFNLSVYHMEFSAAVLTPAIVGLFEVITSVMVQANFRSSLKKAYLKNNDITIWELFVAIGKATPQFLLALCATYLMFLIYMETTSDFIVVVNGWWGPFPKLDLYSYDQFILDQQPYELYGSTVYMSLTHPGAVFAGTIDAEGTVVGKLHSITLQTTALIFMTPVINLFSFVFVYLEVLKLGEAGLLEEEVAATKKKKSPNPEAPKKEKKGPTQEEKDKKKAEEEKKKKEEKEKKKEKPPLTEEEAIEAVEGMMDEEGDE